MPLLQQVTASFNLAIWMGAIWMGVPHRTTEIRKKFGLEAAQVVCGHQSADVTQIYARDMELALRVAKEVGQDCGYYQPMAAHLTDRGTSRKFSG